MSTKNSNASSTKKNNSKKSGSTVSTATQTVTTQAAVAAQAETAAPEAPVSTEQLSGAAPVPESSASQARTAILSFVHGAFDHIDAVLGSMKVGDKVMMEGLTAHIANQFDLRPERVYPLVSMYVNRRKDCYVRKGRDGGIFGGPRPEVVVDPLAAEKMTAKAAKEEARAAKSLENARALRAKAACVTPAVQQLAATG